MTARKSLAARVYRGVANGVEPLLPRGLRTPAHYLSRRVTRRLEPEYDLIMSMVTPGMTAVDAGANIGIYTFGFLARGANAVAIEPQRTCAAQIEAFYRLGFPWARGRGKLSVHVEALGSRSESAVLHIPLKGGRLDDESARLGARRDDRSEDHPPEGVDIEVPVRALDEYGLDNVQVVKIDVEGLELPLLEGAVHTIRRWRPSILVEIEQRHHREPIADVFRRILSIVGDGYRTAFLREGGLRPLAEFDVERDQMALQDNPLLRGYVRNFFILPG